MRRLGLLLVAAALVFGCSPQPQKMGTDYRFPPGPTAVATTTSDGLMSASQFTGFQNVVTVDLTTGADYLIAPGIAGKFFVPIFPRLLVSAVGGSLTTTATFSIGNDAGTFANLFPASNSFVTATNFSGGVGSVSSIVPGAAKLSVAGADTKLRVTVPAVGTGGLVFTMKIIVFGIYM